MNYFAFKRLRKGTTIIEVLIASAILLSVFVGAITMLNYHRLQSRKAMEQAIMIDFMQHYLEIARAKTFFEILPGQRINELYNGVRSTINIRFPNDGNWYPLTTTHFLNFHPDLVWLDKSSPQYSCTITDQVVGGRMRSKRINLNVRWKPPRGKGGDWLTHQMESVVYSMFN